MARNTMQQSMLNKSRADKFLLVFDVPPILKEFSKKFNQTNDEMNTFFEKLDCALQKIQAENPY